MSHLKPLPAPREISSENVELSRPLRQKQTGDTLNPPREIPKPVTRKLINNLDKPELKPKPALRMRIDKSNNPRSAPIPSPRIRIDPSNRFMKEPIKNFEQELQYDYVEASKSNRSVEEPEEEPPPLPPRPNLLATELNKCIKARLDCWENGDFTKGLLQDKYSDNASDNKNGNESSQNIFRDLCSPKAEKTCDGFDAESKHAENETYNLECFTKRLLNSELQYIKKLEEALGISEEFHLGNLPEPLVLKFFGSLKDIHKLHKEVFYKDLEHNKNNPEGLISCFPKHASKFSIYIQRQWSIPQEETLTDFEMFLIDERDLKQYIQMTKEKVLDYIKILTHLKFCIQSNSSSYFLRILNDAVKFVENLYYQLEMSERLQTIENIRDKYRECGEVYLHNKFKISIHGKDREKYQVYLCKYLIIFTTTNEENENTQYVDDISVSDCYCRVLKAKANIFEIGIKNNKKRYIFKTDNPGTKDKWCERLKTLLSCNNYSEV